MLTKPLADSVLLPVAKNSPDYERSPMPTVEAYHSPASRHLCYYCVGCGNNRTLDTLLCDQKGSPIHGKHGQAEEVSAQLALLIISGGSASSWRASSPR